MVHASTRAVRLAIRWVTGQEAVVLLAALGIVLSLTVFGKTAGEMREGDLRDPRHDERVRDPGEKRERNEDDQRRCELPSHQTTPRPPTTRSISLMPMKGATSPPSP